MRSIDPVGNFTLFIISPKKNTPIVYTKYQYLPMRKS